MPYTIELVRTQHGLSVEETLDRLSAGYDPDAELPPLRLTDAQRSAWQRVLKRVEREIRPVEPEEYLHRLELWTVGPPGPVQLIYDGDSATVEVTYRHSGQTASAVMEVAYRIARITEEETGLTGHDFEVDQPTRTGDPARAAARLAGVSDWAQRNLT
ncbi:hypothetical protein [Streptomyces sp. LaPpAH-108]|uniref:hypothetical protein n=1 Tax=Streptomyces sp. LaPpAH-108 TaxID=1155714 RepID=UPI000373146A|nr:hypothetical protein [Streptomyces sp. LaPpAH-108]